jgi:hypothetical protein
MWTVLLLTIAGCLVSADTHSSYYASLSSKPRNLGEPITKRSNHRDNYVAKVVNDVSLTMVPSFQTVEALS